MKICVTGAAGFIGSNFMHYMHNKYPKYRVDGVDSLTYAGKISNLNGLLKTNISTLYLEDISDINSIDRLFKKNNFDIVVNFAAETHVDNSISKPDVFLKTNVLGTHCLLEVCRKYNVKRFHQVSTDEVYGDLPLDRPDLRFTEESNLHASSPYSASKASADLLCAAYFRTYGIPVTISRCSNNYGKNQHEEKLIPTIVRKAANDESIPVYGDGLNVRDWLHVMDHCAAIDAIIHSGTVGEVYNIGGDCELPNIDVVKTILKRMNKPVSLITYVKDRPGHDRRYAIDHTKITTELGWVPRIKFEDGILDAINN